MFLKIKVVIVRAYFGIIMWVAYKLNETAVRLWISSNKTIIKIFYSSQKDKMFSRLNELIDLHKNIKKELLMQKKNYKLYIYDWGYPYQKLNLIHSFGTRDTEARFEEYNLNNYITRNDHILDIGCNCGFMAIYTSYITGCKADAIDINQYMIKIGEHTAKYLRVDKNVTLKAMRFQEFIPNKKYTVIFSFATHWTDDGQLRPDFIEYMLDLHNLLNISGLLIFESHCKDLGDKQFYIKMESLKEYFAIEEKKLVDNNCRELYILRKIV